MKITNTTKNTVLTENAHVAKNFKDKTLGLTVFSKPATIIFSTHFGIHTFGMKFPIDVLILDRNNQVVALRTNLKPNRIFLWNPKYSTVLELPEGVIKKTGTHLTDQIQFSNSTI